MSDGLFGVPERPEVLKPCVLVLPLKERSIMPCDLGVEDVKSPRLSR